MAALDVRVQIRRDGRPAFEFARTVEVDEVQASEYDKAPSASPTDLPLGELGTLQFLLVHVDQDDCRLVLDNAQGANLTSGGLLLVIGGSMTDAPLGTITYNGALDAKVTVLGGGT